VINVLLNTYWLSITGGSAMLALIPARALKNMLLLPLEALLLFVLIAALQPILKHLHLPRG